MLRQEEHRGPKFQAPSVREGGPFRLRQKPDPLGDLALTFPVLLVYHLGILIVPIRNGADFLTSTLLKLVDYSLAAYAVVSLLFCALLAWIARSRGQRGIVRIRRMSWVWFESTIFAVVMWLGVGWITARIVPNALFFDEVPRISDPLAIPREPTRSSPLTKIVMAAGAGFHEELVFRVMLFGGSIALLRRNACARPYAFWGATLASSLAFSTVHYLGPLGDTFALASFTFRALAGVYLAWVYALRGFAVAVYTHAFYDVLVFIL
ncbi:MAG: CPBP family intramembrane glutamic endopeptidase [Myxococcota bacterium]